MKLRIKDLDFSQRQIVVQNAKAEKSRFTMLPDVVIEPLKDHLRLVQRRYQQDLEQGTGLWCYRLT